MESISGDVETPRRTGDCDSVIVRSVLTVIVGCWRDEDGYVVHPWFFCPEDNLGAPSGPQSVPNESQDIAGGRSTRRVTRASAIIAIRASMAGHVASRLISRLGPRADVLSPKLVRSAAGLIIKGLREIEWVNFGGGSAKNLCIG
jgi:hypothetical protein